MLDWDNGETSTRKLVYNCCAFLCAAPVLILI